MTLSVNRSLQSFGTFICTFVVQIKTMRAGFLFVIFERNIKDIVFVVFSINV